MKMDRKSTAWKVSGLVAVGLLVTGVVFLVLGGRSRIRQARVTE